MLSVCKALYIPLALHENNSYRLFAGGIFYLKILRLCFFTTYIGSPINMRLMRVCPFYVNWHLQQYGFRGEDGGRSKSTR